MIYRNVRQKSLGCLRIAVLPFFFFPPPFSSNFFCGSCRSRLKGHPHFLPFFFLLEIRSDSEPLYPGCEKLHGGNESFFSFMVKTNHPVPLWSPYELDVSSGRYVIGQPAMCFPSLFPPPPLDESRVCASHEPLSEFSLPPLS